MPDDPTFRPGEWAMVKATGIKGRVLSVRAIRAGRRWSVSIAINGRDDTSKTFLPDELEHCQPPALYGAAALGQP